MKKIRNRILALMLSCYMVFGVVSTDYIEVQAFEWALPAIGIEEALKWLLALLGVTIAGKAVGDNVNWTDLKEDCIQHQYEMGNSQVAVSKWWSDILSGSLNQASSCWSAFKDWVQGLKGGSVSANGFASLAISNVVGESVSLPTEYNFTSAYYEFTKETATRTRYTFYFYSDYMTLRADNMVYCANLSTFCVCTYNTENKNLTSSIYNRNGEYISNIYGQVQYYDTFFYNFDILSSSTHAKIWDLSSNPSVNEDYDISSYKENVSDIAITDANATTTSIPDTLPLPWDNVSDTAEGVTEVLEGLMEKVQEGIITLEEYMEAVQEMLSVSVIDTTSDEVLPITIVNDEPITWPDVVADNVSNSDFTLDGLQNVFPFCIPWDIKDFVTLLVVPAVAPTIHYPIQNGFTHETEYIDIDFEDWEPIVILFRYIFDFLLIIGLLLLARSLVGAGGSD